MSKGASCPLILFNQPVHVCDQERVSLGVRTRGHVLNLLLGEHCDVALITCVGGEVRAVVLLAVHLDHHRPSGLNRVAAVVKGPFVEVRPEGFAVLVLGGLWINERATKVRLALLVDDGHCWLRTNGIKLRLICLFDICATP